MLMLDKFGGIVKRYVVVLLAFILVAGFVVYAAYTILGNVVEKSLEEVSKQGACLVENDIQRHLDILTAIAKNETVRNPDSAFQ